MIVISSVCFSVREVEIFSILLSNIACCSRVHKCVGQSNFSQSLRMSVLRLCPVLRRAGRIRSIILVVVVLSVGVLTSELRPAEAAGQRDIADGGGEAESRDGGV